MQGAAGDGEADWREKKWKVLPWRRAPSTCPRAFSPWTANRSTRLANFVSAYIFLLRRAFLDFVALLAVFFLAMRDPSRSRHTRLCPATHIIHPVGR
jgi:hypothetical protein